MVNLQIPEADSLRWAVITEHQGDSGPCERDVHWCETEFAADCKARDLLKEDHTGESLSVYVVYLKRQAFSDQR